MVYEEVKVQYQNEIAPGIFDLSVGYSGREAVVPGQFVDVYIDDGSKLLPRPISICDAGDDWIRMVYRVTGCFTGTAKLSGCTIGNTLRITAPVGRGYPVDELRSKASEDENIVLMGGGIGIPPMLYLAKSLRGECTVVLGYRSSDTFLGDEFEAAGAQVLVVSDDGSVGVHGTVIDALKESGIEVDVICACGPKPMLKAVKEYAKGLGITAYISLEERMACGVGACLGCVTRTTGMDDHSRVKNARVCVDGPVFDASLVEL